LIPFDLAAAVATNLQLRWWIRKNCSIRHGSLLLFMLLEDPSAMDRVCLEVSDWAWLPLLNPLQTFRPCSSPPCVPSLGSWRGTGIVQLRCALDQAISSAFTPWWEHHLDHIQVQPTAGWMPEHYIAGASINKPASPALDDADLLTNHWQNCF
jgi:hypothetical protein